MRARLCGSAQRRDAVAMRWRCMERRRSMASGEDVGQATRTATVGASLHLVLLLIAVSGVRCQFGNLQVNWKEGIVSSPVDTQPPSMPGRQPSKQSRDNNLSSLSTSKLREIAASLDLECPSCISADHWASKVRHGVIEMQAKQLKLQLSKRDVKCAGCTQREHFTDSLLDSVHLPVQL